MPEQQQLGMEVETSVGAPNDSVAVVKDGKVVAVTQFAITDARVAVLADLLLGFAAPGYGAGKNVPQALRQLARDKAREAMFEIAMAAERTSG